ncbi:WD40-repeat-containing domain protein [Lentinula edodes]|uniref:WD40-repeat-containing domain protein n=1 Tax=Lentinula lateritia TaxID=40482 RepID=A0A9W9DMA1_9AGAR|nr:WD40-repeat-containing domain protein [Lentinula edodes]
MPYENQTVLQGPQIAVTSLAFSAKVGLLAAAGPGGANVWDLQTRQSIPLTSQQAGAPQPETTVYLAAAWSYFMEISGHILLLGSWDGSVQLWDYMSERSMLESIRKPVYHTSSVQVVSLDVFQQEVPAEDRAQLVASFLDRSVVMWTLSAQGELKKKFSIALEDGFLAQTVRFDTTTGNIYAFAMQGGKMGCALVYDVETGKVDQSLKYHLGGLVQAVATASTSDHFLVAIAGSNGRQASNVVLWQKKRPSPSILRSTLSKKSDPDVLYIPLNKNTFDDLHLFSATLCTTVSIVATYVMSGGSAMAATAIEEPLSTATVVPEVTPDLAEILRVMLAIALLFVFKATMSPSSLFQGER